MLQFRHLHHSSAETDRRKVVQDIALSMMVLAFNVATLRTEGG